MYKNTVADWRGTVNKPVVRGHLPGGPQARPRPIHLSDFKIKKYANRKKSISITRKQAWQMVYHETTNMPV